jgi:hypothetical protein
MKDKTGELQLSDGKTVIYIAKYDQLTCIEEDEVCQYFHPWKTDVKVKFGQIVYNVHATENCYFMQLRKDGPYHLSIRKCWKDITKEQLELLREMQFAKKTLSNKIEKLIKSFKGIK